MKADEQPEDWHPARDPYEALTEQENGYLPSQDNQSWREQEAMGFTVSHEDSFADSPADIADEEPIEQEQILEPVSSGRGLKGVMFALLMVPVLAFAIAAFTAPAILTADFWRAHWDAASSMAKPASAPANTLASAPPVSASVPAPVVQRAPPPARAPAAVAERAPPPAPAPPANPDLNTAPAASPAPDTNAVPVIDARANTDTTPEAAPTPTARPATPPLSTRPAVRAKADDRDTGGFYAMVAGPSGTLEYRYFPSNPTR
jgi:hypothetical protein